MKTLYLLIFIFILNWDGSAQFVGFSDETYRLKYVTGTMGQAKCAVDMNGDGLDDITRVSKEGIFIDFQQADGLFKQIYYQLNIAAIPEWSICAGDFDRDGSNDLLFGSQKKVSFLKNSIFKYKFTETIMPEYIFSQRSTIFDINNDGHLDAFVCNDVGKSLTYRNNGFGVLNTDSTLINTSFLAGNYSAIWSDYNNDGFSDLYISKCKAEAQPGNEVRTNLLYKNNGNGTFSEVGQDAGVNDNAQSWTSVFEDFDNDGDMDLFVVNHDQQNRLFRNIGDGVFTNVIADSGIDANDLGAFEAVGGDFNNDGNMDIISDLSEQLYLGNGDLTFKPQKLPCTPGAIGDFNNDGFLDVTKRSQLWINNGNKNHWIKLMLKGIESNTNGIGCRVDLYGKWGRQTRELRSGQSYSPMNSLNLHFGLGQYKNIDSLIIKWPSGIVTLLKNIPCDSTFFLVEAACSLDRIQLPINEKIMLCPGAIHLIEGPLGYKKYIWSDGSSDKNLSITSSGKYYLVYEDTLGCRGISNIVNVEEADKDIPQIDILNSEYPVCLGNEIKLKSSAGNASKWSEGSKNVDEIVITKPDTYFVSIDSLCGNGLLSSEAIHISFFETTPPLIETIENLAGDSIKVSLIGDSCFWYNQFGALLFTGCNTIISNVTADTIFYVFNQQTFMGSTQSCGKPDTSGYNINFPLPRHLNFTVWKPFVLNSVDMYIKNEFSEGLRNISLVNDQNEVLKINTSDLKTGQNTVMLNFDIKPGRYKLLCDRVDQLTNVGPLDYPFAIGGFGQIDSSSFGLQIYPYFYNWKIRPEDMRCKEGIPILIHPSSTYQTEGDNKIEVFPSPAIEEIMIRNIDDSEYTLWSIMSLEGRLIRSGRILNKIILPINVSDLYNGVFLLMLESPKKSLKLKFIVMNP